jgi:hypothetical protein
VEWGIQIGQKSHVEGFKGFSPKYHIRKHLQT